MRVWCCGPTGVPGAVWPGRGAGLLDVPVGGGPPARRPRRELRSARRLEARPGPPCHPVPRLEARSGPAARPCRALCPGAAALRWWASVYTREKVRPASLLDRESAKKFALRAQNGLKLGFCGLLGEFCRGRAAGGAVPGEFFRGNVTGGVVLGEFFRANRCCARPCRRCGALQVGGSGGFALHEAFWRRVAGVSNPRVVQFPPIGGGEAAVCGGVAAKVQTHWVKNGEKSLLWLNGSAFWRIRCLSWCVVRARTRYVARKPAWSVGGSSQARISGLTRGITGPGSY